MTPATARVLIVEDHRLLAEAIQSTLEDAGMDVLAIAMNGGDGLNQARTQRPDLVLMDIRLPDENGLETGRKILEESPETKVVALSAWDDSRAVAEAMHLGFRGFVSKNSPISQFLSSLNAVLEGQVVVPKELARHATGLRSAEERQADLLIEHLTSREREVLQLLAEGSNGKRLAARLGVSLNTVRTHIQNILAKLQVHSRLEAATFAVQHGVVRPPDRADSRPLPLGGMSRRSGHRPGRASDASSDGVWGPDP